MALGSLGWVVPTGFYLKLHRENLSLSFVIDVVHGMFVLLCLSLWGDLVTFKICANQDTFENEKGAKNQEQQV